MCQVKKSGYILMARYRLRFVTNLVTPFSFTVLRRNTYFSQDIGSDVFQIIHISLETVWTKIFFFTFILFFSCF
jgi:hypothetical protein